MLTSVFQKEMADIDYRKGSVFHILTFWVKLNSVIDKVLIFLI